MRPDDLKGKGNLMKKIVGCIAAIAGLILVIAGINISKTQVASISIIGGADGPTSIFLAGKIPSTGGTVIAVIGGIILIAVVVGIIVAKRKK